MDDFQLWQELRAGGPVAHCRARLEHQRLQMIERRNRAAQAHRRAA